MCVGTIVPDLNTLERVPLRCINTVHSTAVEATTMEANRTTTMGSTRVLNRFPQHLRTVLDTLLELPKKPNESSTKPPRHTDNAMENYSNTSQYLGPFSVDE